LRSRFAVLAAVVLLFSARAYAQPLTVTTLAGHSGGAVDGPGSVALFDDAVDVAMARDGGIYVADVSNHVIRKISPAGMVTTFAGLAYGSGSQDGTGSGARFNNPAGVATDSSGNLYVADSVNSTIRKITPAGVVTTLAGLANSQGYVDGTGADARLVLPTGIAVDHHGNVYLSDAHNNTIRKITAAGVVTTFAGMPGVAGSADGNGSAARFWFPYRIDVDSSGNLYVADSGNHTIRKITPAGDVTTFAGAAGIAGTTNGTRLEARFTYPENLTVDDSGNLYVVTYYAIRKITPAGDVTTLAGEVFGTGHVDANGTNARFVRPYGMTADGEGNVYVGDENMIRKITPDGTVSTVAGRRGGSGFTNGTGSAARFGWAYGMAAAADGSVFVADLTNNAIRKVSPAGTVTTFAASVGFPPSLKQPRGVAVDGDGFVYVADTSNSAIRKISPSGTVTNFAGLALSTGSTDATGEAARFNMPSGVAVGDGIVYVADTENHTIRKILATGEVSTLAGLPLNSGTANGTGSAARFNRPEGLVVDASGYVYVADTHNHAIRKISPAGQVTTLAGLPGSNSGNVDGSGTAARFNQPKGITLDAAGNLYVANSGGNTIRMITPAGVVTTVAGLATNRGTADGTGTAARFSSPAGVAVGADGRLYIADMGNYSVRVGVPALPDAATIDVSDGPVFVPRQLDTAPQTATDWSWSIIRRPAGSSNDVSATTVRDPTFVPDAPGLFTFQLLATAASVPSITTVDLTVPAPTPVDLGPPSDFSATGVSATEVVLSWTPVSGATYYEIFRSSSVGGTFVLHNSCPAATCSDFNVLPGVTYLYKVRAMDDGGPSSFGAVDTATTSAFTDHPLSAGTRAKAVHVLELRTAINAMRAAAGLPLATFAASVGSGSKIVASAIDELRAAVDPARAALGLPAMTYDDATLTPQATSVKAAHVTQLRVAVE
jgi:sugar lactone lactonase YvrE